MRISSLPVVTCPSGCLAVDNLINRLRKSRPREGQGITGPLGPQLLLALAIEGRLLYIFRRSGRSALLAELRNGRDVMPIQTAAFRIQLVHMQERIHNAKGDRIEACRKD